MKVVFIVRSTLFTVKGGDTVQVLQTAQFLGARGIQADIKLTHEPIHYESYDLLHFFNITRPADILYHITRCPKPFVVSPILVDYSEYDRHHRPGVSGWLFRFLHPDAIEYCKTIARWICGRDVLGSKSYLWKGHRRSVREILTKASMVLPNSLLEYNDLAKIYQVHPPFRIVPYGVDTTVFREALPVPKDSSLVICAARIEGRKNQYNLIRALNNTAFKLLLIGAPAPNQTGYYRRCRKIAASNVFFIDQLPQETLASYYRQAKVHVLPSWFETCGLSSLEATVAGCNVVVTKKGYTSEYYGDDVIYCEPSSPDSIRQAVQEAVAIDIPGRLKDKIAARYTWEQAAVDTHKAYRQVVRTRTNLRIGILGTRGIPNHYGGFEQFAEHLSEGLTERGHEVFVYNSHKHPYQEKRWKKVRIVHAYDPEYFLGTFGQFVYDVNCMLDARRKKLDVILMLGYTSSSVWGWLFPKNASIIYNMDGLEWKRTKYSKAVQQFLLKAEKLAISNGNYHIADSPIIQQYLQNKYQIPCAYIPYGAEIFDNEDEHLLRAYRVAKGNYYLLIARLEPENNVETILEGFANSRSTRKFLVVGDIRNKFGKSVFEKFRRDSRICFVGAIYNDTRKIHTLKTFSSIYFHGHSVGGTNPSLLEAMASRALIAAHDNPFNRAVLEEDAYYFQHADDVTSIIEHVCRGAKEKQMIENNLVKIRTEYTWSRIIQRYEMFMYSAVCSKPQADASSMIKGVPA